MRWSLERRAEAPAVSPLVSASCAASPEGSSRSVRGAGCDRLCAPDWSHGAPARRLSARNTERPQLFLLAYASVRPSKRFASARSWRRLRSWRLSARMRPSQRVRHLRSPAAQHEHSCQHVCLCSAPYRPILPQAEMEETPSLGCATHMRALARARCTQARTQLSALHRHCTAGASRCRPA